MSDLLEVNRLDIRLRQEGKLLVSQAGFKVREGRALAVVGESGSGKTLICKAVMQLLSRRSFAVSGSIRYRGRELLDMDDKAVRSLCGSKLAMIVQNPMTALDPSAKIGNQMAETLRAHLKIPRREALEAAAAALEKTNLPRPRQLMNSYPHALSGGMLQRIIVAMALMQKPDLIIADEATTALDVRNQGIILDELAQLKSTGIGLILITHDFAVAARLADDVIVMKEGRAVEAGPLQQVFASPQEAYTRELLAASILVREETHDSGQRAVQAVYH
ncbi:ABC transporter ATP-binding protein [Paenibacillus sp. YN15]|uniref:ATP-binding cassette domain-containing protein n=1 Tax=Paenibacillus sp. YN15 TaxID=1742774 RepID=UPI000DCD2C61|nr:ABC transporter ATP-binding protein [Paenibacillus sp. YN15]RAV05567.1 ABC transporter ATP-binding protein [Paenibacillus sp. YN15]